MLDIGLAVPAPLPRHDASMAGEIGLSVWTRKWAILLDDACAEGEEVYMRLSLVESNIVSTDLTFPDCQHPRA